MTGPNTAYAPLGTGIATLATAYPHKVKVVTLEFVSDHKMMKDQTVVWDDSGLLYAKPEFIWGARRANPISHSHDMQIAVAIEVELEPPSVPPQDYIVTGKATWRSANKSYSMTFQSNANLKGGKQKIEVRSRQKLPLGANVLDGEIDWSLEAPFPAGSTGPAWGLKASWTFQHKIFVTLGKPIVVAGQTPGSREGTYREWGITQKRMAAAIEWIPPDTTDPHYIAEMLKSKVRYTLVPDPSVPAQFDHPLYWNLLTGAWPVFEYHDHRAHCQAIIRLVIAMMRIAGVQATYRFIVVWEEPTGVPGVTAGIQSSTVTEANETTLGLNTKRTVGREIHEAALIAGRVRQGATYSMTNPGHPQPNKYEACLELSDATGTTKYYGGGSGTWATEAEAVTKSFWGLAWIHRLGDQYRVVEIVKTY